jgi:ATP-binding cassette subfamily B protein
MRIFSTLRQLGGRRFDVYLALLVGTAVLPVLATLVARRVVDELVAGMPLAAVFTLIGLEAGIIGGKVALDQVLAYLGEELRFLLIQGIQIRNAQQAATLDIAFFEDPEQCNLLHRIRRESYHRPMMLFGALGNLLTGLTTTVGFFIAIAVWQPILAVLFLLGTLPLLVWGQKAAGSSWMSHDISTADGRWAAYFDDLLCEREAAKEVRLYDLPRIVLPRLRNHDTRHRRTQMGGVRAKTLGLIPGRLAGVVSQYSAVVWAAYQVSLHALSIGQLTVVLAALAASRQILQSVIAEYIEIQENRYFFDELLRFWGLRPTITTADNARPVSPLRTGIRFEQVSFHYPGTDRLVLRDIDIEIPRGASMAIVGLNGAGKTTLIKLLARLYDPTVGRILWDGQDIRELDASAYREQLSMTFQDPVHYQLSLQENITIGSAFACERSRIESVLAVLGLHRLRASLHDGINTLLGRQFHVHGAELSGGQWQRVAVARALYKRSSLLVLDEPTSAMDAQQEALLYDSISDWKSDRTLILISHRLSSVRQCDTIVVLDQGRIVQVGGHEALMREEGAYRELFETQARGYELAEDRAGTSSGAASAERAQI